MYVSFLYKYIHKYSIYIYKCYKNLKTDCLYIYCLVKKISLLSNISEFLLKLTISV